MSLVEGRAALVTTHGHQMQHVLVRDPALLHQICFGSVVRVPPQAKMSVVPCHRRISTVPVYLASICKVQAQGCRRPIVLCATLNSRLLWVQETSSAIRS